MEIAEVTEEYYANNAEKLRRMVDSILKKYGGISYKDKDEFYSLANEVFWTSLQNFNGIGAFGGFLYLCLTRKIQSLITKKNRKKRCAVKIIMHDDGYQECEYADELSLEFEYENGYTLAEIIPSNENIEDRICDQIDFTYDESIQKYLNHLPTATRGVAILVGYGFSPAEIRKKLHITERDYMNHLNCMKAYENIRLIK